jgi:hypothetical protein
MSDHQRGEEPPAPGHWRVIAQPYARPASAPPSTSPTSPRSPSPLSEGGPVAPPVVPARGGGHPLVATAICAGILLLWLLGERRIHPESGDAVAYAAGVALAGAIFGAILWAIAFAITVRKASGRWKWGSLAILASVGALVALSRIGSPAAPPPPLLVPVVQPGK